MANNPFETSDSSVSQEEQLRRMMGAGIFGPNPFTTPGTLGQPGQALLAPGPGGGYPALTGTGLQAPGAYTQQTVPSYYQQPGYAVGSAYSFGAPQTPTPTQQGGSQMPSGTNPYDRDQYYLNWNPQPIGRTSTGGGTSGGAGGVPSATALAAQQAGLTPATNAAAATGAANPAAGGIFGRESLFDPANFNQGYTNLLVGSGINPLTGRPGAEYANALSSRAYANYLSDLFTGQGNPADTSGAINAFIGNGGVFSPSLGSVGSALSNLLNLYANPQLAQSTLQGMGPEQAQMLSGQMASLGSLLENPNQALSYVSGALSPSAGFSRYFSNWLNAAARQLSAVGDQLGPLDLSRALLGFIPGNTYRG